MSDADAIIAALRAERDTLAAVVDALDADDLARPSGLPGWDVSQVLSHLGNGAQGPGFPRELIDTASATRSHLREFAMHSWDVRVAFDPHATLLPLSTEVLLHSMPPDSTHADVPQAVVEVTTSEPTSTFTLRLQEPVTVDFETPGQPDGTLTLPAEAWVRLLAGRLPAQYTPANVATTGAVDLDELRSIFPGRCEQTADAPVSQHPAPPGDIEPEQDPSSRRARGRARKWLRRLGITAAATFAAVTAFSLIFNAVTQPPSRIDPGFGEYVQVGTFSVHYQTWGTSGTPIVLVPGFLESSIVWSQVGPMLGENHVVYALDLPGHGYTRYTGPMRLDNQAQLVDGFVQALHLQRPILVGHSMGAAVVGSVALAHPQDIRKVVFADGDGLKLNLGPEWLRAVILDNPYMTTAVRIGERWTAVDKWYIKSICGPVCPALSTTLTEQWIRPLRQRSDEQALHDLMLKSDYGLTPQQISAISVPSAIIWGSRDSQGGSLSSAITNLHDPPQHIIDNAGHLTMIADPNAFVRALEAESP